MNVTTPKEFGIPIATDLDHDLDERHLKATLATHGVLCLRMGRRLEKDEFAELTERFGAIKDPVGRTKTGGTYQYSNALQHIDAGYVLTEADREKFGDMTFGGLDDERPGLFETFHCDDTYTEEPALLTILHARALPASGGGPTHFMDMRAAFELLPPDQQEQLKTLTVHYAHNNQDAFPPRRAAAGEADCLVDVDHPLVRRHPVTNGLALFIDLDRACQVNEMTVSQGRTLLQSLQDHAEANAPRCQHDWQTGDVLLWDNASVQHKAGGDFAVGEERRFWRHMISGPAPEGAMGSE